MAGRATEAEGVAAAQDASGETVDIVTPTGGESVTEGTILEWSVKVGDAVKDGDTVVEISTDKVDMELPAPGNGTITEILADEGETVTVGQVIARMSVGAGAARAIGQRRQRRVDRAGAQAGSAGPTPPAATARGQRRRHQRLAGSPPHRGRRGSGPLVDPRYCSGRPDHQADVLTTERSPTPPLPPVPAAGRGAAHQGRRRRAGPLHGPEPLDPDGHLVPHP